MSFKAGKDAFIRIDGVAGSPVNVTAYADQFDFPQPVDTLDVTVFGNSVKQFIPGLTQGGVITQGGPLDVAMGTFLSTINAAQAAGSSTFTIEYSPAGSVASQLKVSAEAIFGGWSISTPVAGRVDYTASWQITGAVATATW